MKRNAAKMALEYIQEEQIIGIGTGSTVNFLIEELAHIKHKIAGTVSSSLETTRRLQAAQIPVLDFNSVSEIPVYIDGADAYNELKQLVKGGGGALTREKILAYASKQFICMVDATKKPGILGTFPVAIEVIPMARSYVARQIIKLGGRPEYRENFTTDNGNIILDVFGWEITHPIELETKLNQIPGLVCNGIFAIRAADILIVGKNNE